MKKTFYYFMTALLMALPIVAQDKDDEEDQDRNYERRSYSYWNRVKLGGAGGVTPIVGMFDNKEIDKYLGAAGLPTLGSDPMYLVGGEGYGYIMFLKNVRMGGFGVTGSRTVNAIQPITAGGNMRKEVEYTVSYGGFLVDYVQPIAHRLDFAIGASIGTGEINITMRRDDGNFKDWNTLWNDFGNPNSTSGSYTRRLNGSFVTFNPRVSIEYTILTWLQVRIGAGYPMMFSPEWTMDDKYELNAVPSKLKTDGLTVNAGLMFGFFGW